ncbi:MAG: AraC family transcriptional regulator [Gorillibacterium sp.]|nr:AraC family transcriptional regulator [Gorillibacterium sp.]
MILVEVGPERDNGVGADAGGNGQAPAGWDFVLDGTLRKSLAPYAIKPLLVKLGEGHWLILIDQSKTELNTLVGRVNANAWFPGFMLALTHGCKAKVQGDVFPEAVPFSGLSAAFDQLRRKHDQQRVPMAPIINEGRSEESDDGEAMSRRRGEQLIGKAGDYIRRNLTSDIGIEEVAGHLGISCSYFSMLFKAHFGETFVEHVTKQRMERAMNMLLTSDRSITRIGMLVGYTERRYFTKVFQKYAHVTPSEYREAGKSRLGSE